MFFILARPLDRLFGRGSDPFQRPDAGLITDFVFFQDFGQTLHHARDGLFDLPLIAVALFDRRLRQSMSGEQDSRIVRPPGLLIGVFNQGDMGADKIFLLRIATHRTGLFAACILPRLQRRAGRRGGELRIERQQHGFVRLKGFDGLHRFIDERVPVAHGQKAFDLVTRHDRVQRPGERRGLLLRFRDQRRPASHLGVVFRRFLGAGGRDQPGQRLPDRTGSPDDCGITKQISQERLDAVRAVRSAQIKQHHRDAPAHIASFLSGGPHALHKLSDMVRRRLKMNSVSQIEHIGPTGPCGKQPVDLVIQLASARS